MLCAASYKQRLGHPVLRSSPQGMGTLRSAERSDASLKGTGELLCLGRRSTANVSSLGRAQSDRQLMSIVERACVMLALALTVFSSGADAEVTYPRVVPGYRIELPRDEGSHPQFKTEWWYVTGWLQNGSGDPLGFQLTFFRSRTGIDADNPSRFALRQVQFAHLAISDPKLGKVLHHEKSARSGFGLADATEGALDVYIDDWRLRREGDIYHAVAAANDLKLDLQLRPQAPPLLHGDEGFSQKGPQPSSASYYYSVPQLAVTGRISVDGREQAVQGRAWFDHEWLGEIVDERAQGWDWVGLNLNDGGAAMMFQMRDASAGEPASETASELTSEPPGKLWAAATWRAGAGGNAVKYKPQDVAWKPLRYWRSPRTGIRYPVEWQVTVGDRVITLRPLMDDQENDARGSTGTVYWEGAVSAFDAQNQLVGRGYLELTGYGAKIRL
jgi:predicted secreted hydrolase